MSDEERFGYGAACSLCGREAGDDEDGVLAVVKVAGRLVCDECVDAGIEVMAEIDLVPDLRPLHPKYIFQPKFLTENDVRGDLSLYTFKSLDDDHREALIGVIVGELRDDELTGVLIEAVNKRMNELMWRVLAEQGFADQARLRPDVYYAITGEELSAEDEEE